MTRYSGLDPAASLARCADPASARRCPWLERLRRETSNAINRIIAGSLRTPAALQERGTRCYDSNHEDRKSDQAPIFHRGPPPARLDHISVARRLRSSRGCGKPTSKSWRR